MDKEKFAELATTLTFIFGKLEGGGFKCIIDKKTLSLNTWDDLQKYYLNFANSVLANKAELPNLPDLKKEVEMYTNRAVELATLSADKVNGQFVDPISQEVLSIPPTNEDLRLKIETEVSEYFQHKKFLPILPKPDSDWKTFAQQKMSQRASHVPDESIIAPPNKKQKSNFPANHTVSLNNKEPLIMEVKTSEKVRQSLVPNISSQIKDYDIIKMRDYLRILRRLWILSQLHDGKEKEITRINLVKPDKLITHPYFKDINENLYKRIYQNMWADYIREIEEDE